jgi:hypothetical protein
MQKHVRHTATKTFKTLQKHVGHKLHKPINHCNFKSLAIIEAAKKEKHEACISLNTQKNIRGSKDKIRIV